LRLAAAGAVGALLLGSSVTVAQIPPSAEDIVGYRGLHAAAARDDAAEISCLLLAGANAEARDGNGRTVLHVTAFTSHAAAARAGDGRGAGQCPG
jgi:ankyrin repeat protein